jgi:hypothetical protein
MHNKQNSASDIINRINEQFFMPGTYFSIKYNELENPHNFT